MPYTLKHLYHSTHWVPDLEEATDFFRRVFGRESVVLGEYLGSGRRDVPAGFRNDYATFTPIAEVQLECVDPALMIVDGTQVHASVDEPSLGALAWFVDGIEDLWSELRRRNFHGMDQANRMPQGESPPLDVSSTPIIFTLPEETGLSYELCVYMPRRDPRGDPPVPAVSQTDPLGIECCSHHTVLTDRPDRARRFLVDVLGGQVLHERRNSLLATQSSYIALADAVVEVAQPLEEGSPAMHAWERKAPRRHLLLADLEGPGPRPGCPAPGGGGRAGRGRYRHHDRYQPHGRAGNRLGLFDRADPGRSPGGAPVGLRSTR